jgi:hypothetical protein
MTTDDPIIPEFEESVNRPLTKNVEWIVGIMNKKNRVDIIATLILHPSGSSGLAIAENLVMPARARRL